MGGGGDDGGGSGQDADGGGGGSFHDASLVTLLSANATQTGNGFVDIEPAVSSVPEPSSILLLGIGSLGLLGYGWRRRRQSA